MMIVRCALSNVSCFSSQLSIKHSSIKTLATTCCIQKVKSSSDWFKRHQKDQYVKRAQKDNYRARSAYKLLEIADQHQLLTPGQCVVECGGAPGAWTQVIADRVGSEGLVVSCDLLDFSPVPGVNILPFTDFTAKDSQEKILHLLGGATGIGKAISEELLHLGARVVIASRNEEKIAHAAAEMSQLGEAHYRKCNIRQEEDVKSLVQNTLEKFGRIDYLVNNGGGQFPSAAAHISLKGWNAVIETNLTGTYLLSREVYNQYFQDHGGVVVNIIADMFRGFPLMSHTGAARAAVENLTKSLSVEWAEQGVRVNAVAPGVIYSKTASDNYSKDLDPFGIAKPGVPAQRLGTTMEVASAVCFLLSPGASFISGATLRVDAGGSLYSPQLWQIQEHENIPPYSWNPYKPKL